MKTELSAEMFAGLLAHFDVDRERAGEKYEDLRRTLIKFFEWRDAPFPEEHADETLNRVARKISAGLEIRNTASYCYEVARLVFLEAIKANDGKHDPLPPGHANTAALDPKNSAQQEWRLECLEECLARLPTDNRNLIVEYYRDEKRGRIDRRRALAEQLGLQREALANRAQRLRDKLETCVNRCVVKKSAI